MHLAIVGAALLASSAAFAAGEKPAPAGAPSPVKVQAAAGVNEGLVPLRLGMPSPLGEEQARKDAAALSALLTEAMKRKVVAEVASPKALPKLLASGTVDLGWLSAAQYVEASAASNGAVIP